MARAAAEAIQNRVSISFFLFVFGCCLCYHREKQGAIRPQNRREPLWKKSSLRLQVSRLSCTASAAVRSISMSMAKTAARPRQPALPAQPARQAGRCWLSICRSTAPEKTARKSWCRGWSPGSCRRFTPGCIRYGSISGCMGSASGRGLLCRRCRRKNRRRRCWCPRSWIWKN